MFSNLGFILLGGMIGGTLVFGLMCIVIGGSKND